MRAILTLTIVALVAIFSFAQEATPEPTAAPTATPTPESLDIPQNLAVANGVAVWDEVAGNIAGYQLRWSLDGSNWTEQDVSRSETKFRLDALSHNFVHDLQIRAVAVENSGYVDSDWSSSLSVSTLGRPLPVPDNVRHDAATGKISWDAIKQASSYQVTFWRCSTDTSVSWISLGNSIDKDIPHDPLAPIFGAIQVRAVSQGSAYETDGEWSDPYLLCYVVPRPASDAPANFKIVGTYAVWDAVDAASGYELRWRRTSLTPWTYATVPGAETKYLLNQLALNNEYTIQVRAILRGDLVSEWNQLITELPVPPVESPRPVLQFVEGEMQWDEVSPLPFYHLRLLNCDDILGGTLTSAHTYDFAREPDRHIVYVLQVRANGDGQGYELEGDWSAPLMLCADQLIPPPTATPYPAGYETPTPPPPPQPKPIVPAPVDPPEESRPGCYWSGPPTVELETRITKVNDICTRASRSRVVRYETCSENTNTQSLAEIEPWTTSTGVVDCDLTTPTGLKVVNDVALWDANTNAAGYELQWKQGDADWTAVKVPITETKYRLDALTRNVEYMLQVRALAHKGNPQAQTNSTWSDSVSFKLPLLNLTRPSGLRYDRKTREAVWNPVKGATRYTVKVFRCDTGGNEHPLMGNRYLLNDQRQNVYQVARVRGIFADGHLGPWSQSLIFCFLLSPPKGLQATAGRNSFTWQVDPVEGATGYVVGYRVSGSTDPYTEVTFSTHTGTVDGLASSTQYEVRIRATSDSGESADTVSIRVTTTRPPSNRPDPDPDPDPPPRGTARPTARPTSRPQPQPDPEPTKAPVTCSKRGSPWVQSWTERKGPSNCQHERRCSVTLQQYECTDGRRYNQRIGSPSCGNWYFVGRPSCPR